MRMVGRHCGKFPPAVVMGPGLRRDDIGGVRRERSVPQAFRNTPGIDSKTRQAAKSVVSPNRPYRPAGEHRFMYPGKYASERGDQPAFIMANTGEQVSYAELEARSNRLA